MAIKTLVLTLQVESTECGNDDLGRLGKQICDALPDHFPAVKEATWDTPDDPPGGGIKPEVERLDELL